MTFFINRLEKMCEKNELLLEYTVAEIEKMILEMIEKIRNLKEIEACMRHAIALGYFNPGGSTEGWAKRALAALDQLEKK